MSNQFKVQIVDDRGNPLDLEQVSPEARANVVLFHQIVTSEQFEDSVVEAAVSTSQTVLRSTIGHPPATAPTDLPAGAYVRLREQFAMAVTMRVLGAQFASAAMATADVNAAVDYLVKTHMENLRVMVLDMLQGSVDGTHGPGSSTKQ